MKHIGRLIAVLAAPLLLTGCLLAPGKFVSTFDVNQDRSFTFTYVGEVHALDMGMGDMMKGASDDSSTGDGGDVPEGEPMEMEATPALWQDDSATQADEWKTDGEKSGEMMSEAEKEALAAALAKEKGYRKVEYRGNNVFFIDYAISGRLDHAFLFPYNVDGEVMFPFVIAEVRANGNVRIKAPAFAKANSRADMSGMDKANDKIDGRFTLTTDAEIVSQNNEDGASEANGRRTIVWKVSPATQDAPTVVLKLNP